MPLPPPPANLFAELKAKKECHSDGGISNDDGGSDGGGGGKSGNNRNRNNNNVTLMAALQAKKDGGGGGQQAPSSNHDVVATSSKSSSSKPFKQSTSTLFEFDDDLQAFLFFNPTDVATRDDFVPTQLVGGSGNGDGDNGEMIIIQVPLAPCVYRMCDYTFVKQQPILLSRCVQKLGVLRSLVRECRILNDWIEQRVVLNDNNASNASVVILEEDELGKTRFMELVSSCGVSQTISELLLKLVAEAADNKRRLLDTNSSSDAVTSEVVVAIPRVQVQGLTDFLQEIDRLSPSLQQARNEISDSQSVSFYPGLGELFIPGSPIVCFPEGMEGSPLGCSCVQSWYSEDVNPATQKIKRRFVLVMEFIVSVGDELVFVACTDVYPEFHDVQRNVPIKDLTHRRLALSVDEDRRLLDRLQQRGEFYASVATKNHYLEYYSDSFFPIRSKSVGGGWSGGNNALRPLSKGGRVMVDVKRGIMEGHLAVRGSSTSSSSSSGGDGMSDTVKEAIKLYESSKRTGIAVPFRTCVLPSAVFNNSVDTSQSISPSKIASRKDHQHSDRSSLWMAWPMLVGFSFTARVWGKLLLGMPKSVPTTPTATSEFPIAASLSPRSHKRAVDIMRKRPSQRRMGGVEVAALGGEGSSGSCGYIRFQTQAFDQLVLAEDKKELIRAVARNAGGRGDKWSQMDADDNDDDDDEEDEEDDLEEMGIDVVANKGGASIFLLHGPPGCGKTLTAEAISELLEKPLYIVTAGDLGITASEVEQSLGAVLDLCQTWDALVLIDEADVFLEARSSTEIERNALVCVMLRLLEYYSGCLFLSSNRAAGSIDAAIASRITVMLGYPALDVTGRAKVWKNLVELVHPLPIDPDTGTPYTKILSKAHKASKYRSHFTDEDYTKLAEGYALNGRQIKNSIVLARALARERGTPLSMHVLHRAVTAVAGDEAATTLTATSANDDSGDDRLK